jgi:hypothetical protein
MRMWMRMWMRMRMGVWMRMRMRMRIRMRRRRRRMVPVRIIIIKKNQDCIDKNGDIVRQTITINGTFQLVSSVIRTSQPQFSMVSFLVMQMKTLGRKAHFP